MRLIKCDKLRIRQCRTDLRSRRRSGGLDLDAVRSRRNTVGAQCSLTADRGDAGQRLDLVVRRHLTDLDARRARASRRGSRGTGQRERLAGPPRRRAHGARRSRVGGLPPETRAQRAPMAAEDVSLEGALRGRASARARQARRRRRAPHLQKCDRHGAERAVVARAATGPPPSGPLWSAGSTS